VSGVRDREARYQDEKCTTSRLEAGQHSELASDDKYPSLMYSFRVERNTISVIIPEICQAIVEEDKDEVITCPTFPEEWTTIGEVYRDRWDTSHAMRALGGKHVVLRKPAKSSSLYYCRNPYVQGFDNCER